MANDITNEEIERETEKEKDTQKIASSSASPFPLLHNWVIKVAKERNNK